MILFRACKRQNVKKYPHSSGDSAGVNLVCESVICTETPDDAALEACRALGKALVE